MLNPKVRVLLYAVRHNALAAAGQLALFIFMGATVPFIVSAIFFNVRHHTGLDHGSWIDVVAGSMFATVTLLYTVTIVFNNVDRARRYLRPFAEQTQGFVYRLEEFEQKTREAANRRLNYTNGYPASQLTLF